MCVKKSSVWTYIIPICCTINTVNQCFTVHQFVTLLWNFTCYIYLSIMTAQVLESVVKNCGQTVHDEVASKQTMEELKDLLKVLCLQLISAFLISLTLLSDMWNFSWHVIDFGWFDQNTVFLSDFCVLS